MIFVILLEIFCVLFDGGYWFEKKFIYDRNARMAAFELEQKGQINVLNIGDSLSTTITDLLPITSGRTCRLRLKAIMPLRPR